LNASNALLAIDLVRWFDPESIFLDLGLPFMDGWQAAQILKTDFKGSRLFALSGRSAEEDRRRSIDAGFEDHLVKPVDVRTIEKLLASERDLYPR
jgi:DNA-binding response OmpR family regulator